VTWDKGGDIRLLWEASSLDLAPHAAPERLLGAVPPGQDVLSCSIHVGLVTSRPHRPTQTFLHLLCMWIPERDGAFVQSPISWVSPCANILINMNKDEAQRFLGRLTMDVISHSQSCITSSASPASFPPIPFGIVELFFAWTVTPFCLWISISIQVTPFTPFSPFIHTLFKSFWQDELFSFPSCGACCFFGWTGCRQ